MEVTPGHLERLYVFSLMWSVGALLELGGRRRLEHWLRSQEALALDLPPLSGTDDTMFDYYVTSDGEDAHFHLYVAHENSFICMVKLLHVKLKWKFSCVKEANCFFFKYRVLNF